MKVFRRNVISFHFFDHPKLQLIRLMLNSYDSSAYDLHPQLNRHLSIVTHNIVFRNGMAVVIRKLAERKRQNNVASDEPGRRRTEKRYELRKEMNYVGASNAVWYPFGKPGDFVRRENRPFSACWGEPQIPRNAPLVRLRILRTLSFCDYRPCDFSLLISSDPTPRIRSTLALAVKSSLISVRALFSAFDTLCPFAIHIVSFCKRNIWIY